MTQTTLPEQREDDSGRGLCYSLALFLSHEANVKYALAEVEMMATEGALKFDGKDSSSDKVRRQIVERLASVRWFSRASGSVRNLDVPEDLPQELRRRLRQFKKKCHQWTHPSTSSTRPMFADTHWAVEEAKELIRLIDEHHGIKTTQENPRTRSLKEPALVFRDD